MFLTFYSITAKATTAEISDAKRIEYSYYNNETYEKNVMTLFAAYKGNTLDKLLVKNNSVESYSSENDSVDLIESGFDRFGIFSWE
ncbi:MAG: hypothetical protein GX800_06235 [Clostridiaceae bacterium]|jgi:hypothetical protein|nr:hypothetical protein [Clostridiaceae bacterium]